MKSKLSQKSDMAVDNVHVLQFFSERNHEYWDTWKISFSFARELENQKSFVILIGGA